MNQSDEQETKRRRRTGWDTPSSTTSAPPQPSSSSGTSNAVHVASGGQGMIGEDLKSIIAAKIAAATGGGASATAGGPDPALAMACRIYIGSLYYDLTAQDITALFEGFGEVTKCEMQMDPATGRSKGFCFLEFRTPEQAQASMAMNGFEIAGRKIKVGRPYGGANGAATPMGVGNIVASATAAVVPPAPPVTSCAANAQLQSGVVTAPVNAEPAQSVPASEGEPSVADTAGTTVVEPPVPVAEAPAVVPVELFSVVLENMVTVEEARTNDDLAREVETEAARYGSLTDDMKLEYSLSDSDGEEKVSVVLTYVLAKDAKRSLRAMNGRLFDNRAVTATLR